MPNLADVEAIASSTPIRTVTLSGLTVTVLFSALDAADRLYDWQGAGFDLTPAEVDEIEAILAKARHELMTTLVGQIITWAGMDAPPNCLLCDGTAYTREDYPVLYAAIDSIYHVDPDHFVVPDLRARFILGGTSSSDIGIEGGEENHVLTTGEMPSHDHTIPLTVTTLALEPGEVAVLSPVPILTSSTGSTGGGSSHNNMPPYTTMAYFIVAG
jgi:microcystin-dependent protein